MTGLPLGVFLVTADLAPFDEVVGDARVIGIGEALHVSAGLEEVRVRLTRHAVRELGFRAVGVEAGWGQGRVIDARLQACREGASMPPAELESYIWPGLDPLLQDLCAWNRHHPDDPVRFFGFDVQDPWDLRAHVEAGTPDPELRRCFGAAFDTKAEMRAHAAANDWALPTQEDHEACLARLDELDPTDFGVASLRASQLSAWALMGEQDEQAAYRWREEGMFRAYQHERQRLGSPKTVLLGHDAHVGRQDRRYVPIGAMIAAQDPAYRAIAVQAWRLETRYHPQVPDRTAPDGSRLADLHALGHDELFVVLSDEPHDALFFVDHARSE